ncbi:MAG TPA: hypothetical protein VF137_04005 [Candidatus Dormibacteraeota bacterium]
MRGVRLLAAASVAAFFAATSIQAFALADLRPLLPAPGMSGRWVEGTPGDPNLPDGAMNAHDFAALDPGHEDTVLNELSRYEFVAGYQRSWLKAAGSIVLYESMKVFKTDSGAESWYGGAKDADQAAANWTRSFDTTGLANSYGNVYTDKDGVRTTVIVRKGNDIFHVELIEDGADETGVLSQAKLVFAGAPADSIPQPKPVAAQTLPAAAFAGIGALVIAGLVALWIVVARVSRASRQSQLQPALMGQVSADGRWWWDGAQWRPMAPPPPPSSPASPVP